jgi:uncharacterized glyoxalase superfamily protein PhnB
VSGPQDERDDILLPGGAKLPASAAGWSDEQLLQELQKLLAIEDSSLSEAERLHGHRLPFQPGSRGLFYGVVPVFLVDDIAATCEYYQAALGFQINFTYGEPPVFACVSRNNAMINLNLSQPPGLRNSATAAGAAAAWDAYVLVSHVDEVYEELRARGANIVAAPVSREYGMREFQVEDCNGYRLVLADGYFS